MATSFRLTMQRGPNVGKTYELVKDVVTMGRDMSNDIVINDAESSRHHSRLTKQGNTYVLEDLGSTNGTFVNSARLSTPRTLSPGDVIGMGETCALTYEVIMIASTGRTMVGSIDSTVVASEMPSAKEMQEMASGSAPPPPPPPAPEPLPRPEPATTSMPSPSFEMPSTSPLGADSMSPSSAIPADSLGEKKGGLSRNTIIGIVAGVVVLCCCCPTLIVAAWQAAIALDMI